MELEAAALTADGVRDGYAFALEAPAPLLAAIVADLRAGTAVPLIAARFHLAVAGAVRTACRKACQSTGVRTVVLTGGVFANALLDEMCTAGLGEDGLTVLGHTVVPPGDGGLALGQAVIAYRVADD